MAHSLYSNMAIPAVLSADITASATSINLQSGGGSLFPTIAGGNFIRATLYHTSQNYVGPTEIVFITNITGDTLTVTRGQEGTTAQAYFYGDKIEIRVTAGGLGEFAQSDLLASSSGASYIGCLQSGAGAVVRTAQSKLNNDVFISVKDFGALGDGVTDDAAAIQAAINSLGTVRGILFFPAGVYKVGTTLNITNMYNKTFVGEGGTYQSAYVGTVINFTGTGKLWNVSGCLGLTWEGFRFYGAQAAVTCFYVQGSGIQMRWLKFANMNVEGFDYAFVFGDMTAQGGTTNLFGFQVDRVFIQDCKYAFQLDCQGFDALEIKNVWVNDPNNRMIKLMDVLNNCSGTGTIDNLFADIKDVCTYGIYNNGPFNFCYRNIRIEASGVNPTYVGIYERAAGSTGKTVFEAVSINTSQANAIAIQLGNASGAIFIGGKFWGNISIAPGMVVASLGVVFTGAYAFTGDVTYLTSFDAGTNSAGSSITQKSYYFSTPWLASQAAGYYLTQSNGTQFQAMRTNGGNNLVLNCNSTRLVLTTPVTASTVGTAGGASALPATPLGYLQLSVDGGTTNVKIPYYNN